MQTDFDIVGSFSQERFVQYDGQRTLNMFVIEDPQGKKSKALYPTPGRKHFLTLPSGDNIRRLFAFGTYYYTVSGQDIYRVDNAKNMVHVTSGLQLLTNKGHIGVDANQNNQIAFVDGTGGYIWNNLTATFTKISDPNFPAFPTDIIFMDGFFIVCEKDSPEFNLSAIGDGLTWPGDKARISAKPDTIVGFETLRRQLFIFGNLSTEVWENRGISPGVPFRRSVVLEYGCNSVESIAQGHELLFWLAKTEDGVGSIMMTEGTAPVPISTRQIDEKIAGLTKTTDAVAYLYKDKGQIFYQITFPTDGVSLLYNVNTRQWSELEDLGGKRHIGQSHTFFNNKHIIGSYNSNKLYEQSIAYSDNDGEAIQRQRITRHYADVGYKRLRFNRAQIDFANGLVPETGEDAHPDVFLGVSYDGGVTYPVYLRAPFSKIGQFKHRVIWRRLGTGRDIVFKLDFYNKVPFAVLGGAIDYEVLPS